MHGKISCGKWPSRAGGEQDCWCLTENTVCVEESVCESGDVELDAATSACEAFHTK